MLFYSPSATIVFLYHTIYASFGIISRVAKLRRRKKAFQKQRRATRKTTREWISIKFLQVVFEYETKETKQWIDVVWRGKKTKNWEKHGNEDTEGKLKII